MTAPCHGRAERDWRRATALADDPDAVELMLALHTPREAQRRCVQCGPKVLWPCAHWQVATLARMLQAGASPRRHKRPTS